MKQLTVDINGTCNIACEFCYQDLDGSELSLDQVSKIVADTPNTSVVNIGGGEPLIHKDIVPIIQMLYDNNKRAHISTNATVIPQGMLSLDDAVRNNTSIQVSINAATRETYEAVTGKDMFDRVLKNVDLLKPKYHTSLSAVIYRKNFDEVDQLIDLGASLGLPVRFSLAFPAGKGKLVEKITPEEANWLRGHLLVKEIAHPGSSYGPLVHEITCPLLTAVYTLGKKEGFDCLAHKVYHDPRGVRTSCEFIQ
jgi:MoaA/NifB/PqqE/SkfB family radical SAM enzyme